MKKEYKIDYKGFISDWRCRWIETPKDIRKGKIWKPFEITVPDPWSETATYSIKMGRNRFFMVVENEEGKFRHLLDRELLRLLSKYEHEVYVDEEAEV